VPDRHLQLAGKTLFVTGSGSGIGRAIVDLCLERGANCGGFSAESTELPHERFTGFTGFTGFVGDVADEAAIRDAVHATADRFGQLDGVVCNAGIMTPDAIDDLSAADLTRHLDVNVAGMAWPAKHAFDHLKKTGGSVVLCASIMAYTAAPGAVAYTTTKAASLGLMRSIAMDGAPHGIRCNAVCPGTIDTPMYRRHIDAQVDPDAEHARFSRLFPLGRIGKPRDVAAAVAFLLSDDASYVTGSELIIDGGFMIKGTNE
jgi:NAD(P)-dependent dehydrogenase (short-subunit alcohol dehydrogenase family)